jgi:segregation and condensation protein A
MEEEANLKEGEATGKLGSLGIYEPEAKVETYQPEDKAVKKDNNSNKWGHVQVYNIVTGDDPSWQGIIYELINSEQIDPWDVDIALLCNSYFEKIKEMEEANFFVSSKILLAASLLLRIKSEILLERYIKDIDEILFGKKEDKKYELERIEIDESEIPFLEPKSPLPRHKKVTLDELMSALDSAIKTENRRIHKEIEQKQRERLVYVDVPKHKKINIKDRIRQFYAKIISNFKNPKHSAKLKLPYSHFTGEDKDQKIACFLPMLHLSNNNKLWLEQMGHFDEIWIYMYDIFKKNFPDHDNEIAEAEKELMEEIEHVTEKLDSEQQKRVAKINKDFENPIGDLISEE